MNIYYSKLSVEDWPTGGCQCFEVLLEMHNQCRQLEEWLCITLASSSRIVKERKKKTESTFPGLFRGCRILYQLQANGLLPSQFAVRLSIELL